MRKGWKNRICLLGMVAMCANLGACVGVADNRESSGMEYTDVEAGTDQDSGRYRDSAWTSAAKTPLGKYPELVTYTLGKITSDTNSNMPAGNTYEDNNYTRYLKKLLNVQNENVIAVDSGEYERLEWMAVQENNLPDVMVVTGKEVLDYLVEHDMVEDLSEVYENCTSPRIKSMYNSYGDDLLGEVTYDGKLMAFPETEVYSGPAVIWLRNDWMDQLGLAEPENLEDALGIVRIFAEENPGNCETGNIGLAMDPVLVEKTNQCFSAAPLMDYYGAFPGKWIPTEEGTMEYGSIQPEMKEALARLRAMYEVGSLDADFMIRNGKNFAALLENQSCGAFFGWWWAPNAELFNTYDGEADWQPYVCSDSTEYTTSLSYGNERYVVVRKGYEHPEVVAKILTALYDYARYDGKNEAVEVGEFLGRNVGAEATPFNINLDYSDATFRVTDSLKKMQSGKINYMDLSVLERGYWDSCSHFLEDKQPTASVWAAYTSRMNAMGKLTELDISYVNEGYTREYANLITDELQSMEQKAFLMIITGEVPLDYFDTFVEQWYDAGGQELTEQANVIRAASED